jgi:hypothetical protein
MTEKNLQVTRDKAAKSILAFGQAMKDPKGVAIESISQALAGAVRGDGKKVFGQIIENLAKKGEIDEEFTKKAKGRFFTQEIIYILKHDTKDEAMLLEKIKLYTAIASKKYIESDFDEVKEIWSIVNSLNTLSIRVLATAVVLPSNIVLTDEREWDMWVAKTARIKYMEFVAEARRNLDSHGLIDMSHPKHLSELGLGVAGYLEEGTRLFELAKSDGP